MPKIMNTWNVNCQLYCSENDSIHYPIEDLAFLTTVRKSRETEVYFYFYKKHAFLAHKNNSATKLNSWPWTSEQHRRKKLTL